jgi:methyltransferase
MQRSKALFILGLFLLAVQRLWELRHSNRHADAALRSGGREHAPQQYQLMKVLHTSWFAAITLEVLGLRRRFRPRLAGVAGMLFLAGQFLRYAAIRSLGERWTARVITLPGAPPVTTGIYRYLRHPNYLGVTLEIAAVPLIHSAYWTALLYTLANLLLLRQRIRVEEQALTVDNDYASYLGETGPPWLRGLRQRSPRQLSHDQKR